MAHEPIASTSAQVRAHIPARWIVSLGNEGHSDWTFPTTQRAHECQPPPAHIARLDKLRAGVGTGSTLSLEDWQGAYGPTTRRRGRMRFVPAQTVEGGRLPGDESGSEKVGAGEGADKGKGKREELKRIYEFIVGSNSNSRATSSTPKAKRAALPPPDVDLTLDSDGSSDLEFDSESEDDLVILDELGLPENSLSLGRTRAMRHSLPSALDLLPTSLQPQALPVQYAFKETSFGYRFLARQGWLAGRPLGPDRPVEGDPAHSKDKRLIVPLRAEPKFDRRGLGPNSEEDRRERKEEARAREKVREGGSLGLREMERNRREEERERRAMLAYMNS